MFEGFKIQNTLRGWRRNKSDESGKGTVIFKIIIYLAAFFLMILFWRIAVPILLFVLFVYAWHRNQVEEAAKKARQEARMAAAKEEWLAAQKEKEIAKAKLRDSDIQPEPYTYEIGRHANETLAMRYGIANTVVEVTPYFYYAKGGAKIRNPDRDTKRTVDGRTIKLRKLEKVIGKEDQYIVELSDFRNRKAIAVIEKGTEYVKTFLPIDKDWFEKHSKLEVLLKGNKTMRLSEIAKTHRDYILKIM
ncbi:heme biosynthesis HemY N-terminal domain-containing protein [Ruegeria sp. 1NDH52C]|uniref:Heme biosynthesis HemY N-terminal domain-containing protein n=1 Tax=Ruegeria alba TaxID=2916756 RepID=A0ABS9NVL1_9RHOB|nr:heme biosynthesis HemY N-terminal domain-containing protein [Ruegeria alba]MCG6558260.1 heme biosynthesis HemY N-terminal domain-containing protein [Ruegeria alba]